MHTRSRLFATIALFGAVIGLVFAATSTLDYARHLDRRLHDVHCSFIPGAPPTSEAEACRTAMYSPYAALLRDQYWGGLPISLFALGAFSFFVAFALYLAVAGASASRKSVVFFAIVGTTPLLVSILMFAISAIQLGSFCKTCVGIYIASFIQAAGCLLLLTTLKGEESLPPRPAGTWSAPAAGLVTLALVSLIPAVVYAASVPDHRPYLATCGQLKAPPKESDQLLSFSGEKPVRQALFFEDPLCPTCKAFHQRLKAEGVLDRVDAQLSLFPLDSECNWMLDVPLHPGACTVSKAVLCGKAQAREVLEWAYDQQEYLTRAGKAGEGTVKAAIAQRWGQDMVKCVDSAETKQRLDKHLRFAVQNAIPVSTPQVYLGKQRICDEDTDIGLRYTLKQLAPEVLE